MLWPSASQLWLECTHATQAGTHCTPPKLVFQTRPFNFRSVHLDRIIGFGAKYLKLEPSMDVILFPHVVAKYLGFQQARGAKPGYLSTMAQELKSAIPFVQHAWCPKYQTFTPEYFSKVATWWERLSTRMRSKAREAPKPVYVSQEVTLWDAWMHIDTKWDAFKHAFKVSRVREGIGLQLELECCGQKLQFERWHWMAVGIVMLWEKTVIEALAMHASSCNLIHSSPNRRRVVGSGQKSCSDHATTLVSWLSWGEDTSQPSELEPCAPFTTSAPWERSVCNAGGPLFLDALDCFGRWAISPGSF